MPATASSNKRAAILYDFLQVRGGAEAVTLDVCAHFPEMDLVTGFVNPQAFPESPLEENRLKALTGPTQLPGWQTIKTCEAFKHKAKFLSGYDTLVFSGSNAPLAIKHSTATKNIYYCHTPPRFVYDLKDYYSATVKWWQKPLHHLLVAYLKPQYEHAIQQMDVVLANSENIKQRLKAYLNVDATVVYPPCRTDRFKWLADGDFYLSTARVEDYKRVGLIVEAFKQLPDKQLVVASGGSALEKLKQQAAGYDNIKFTGWVSESELADLMGKCLATIYIPKDEDFGMSPVESMGAGKPVIGVNEGGVKETVEAGETGFLLCENPTTNDMISLITSLNEQQLRSMRNACEKRATKFSADAFFQALEAYVN